MKINIKYSQVKALVQVMQKLGDVPAAGSAFKVARNLIALKPLAEAVDKVNTSVSAYVEYGKKQAELLEKHAKRDDRGQAITEVINTPQGQALRYDLADTEAYTADLQPLITEYAEAISAENERMRTLPEAMEQEIEAELTPIEPDWCDGILNAKEIVVLLECKLC
jgi:hypothetical protein